MSAILGHDLEPREVICAMQIMPLDYTARHLFQRGAEHKYSAIGKHLIEGHCRNHPLNESQFNTISLTIGQSKFDCLVFEKFYIKKLNK